MRDNLQDLITYTYGLGVIDTIKIVGTDKETKISAVADNRTVVIEAQTKNPIPEFIGTFGMPLLSKLHNILSVKDYDENAKISVTNITRDGEVTPVSIQFETKSADLTNEYRFMAKVIVEEKIQNIKFKTPKWDIEFVPSVTYIQRLKTQANVNSEEEYFTMKTVGNNLMIYFADQSTHNAKLIFQENVSGTLNRAWKWPVKVFLSIMDLAGDKTIRISDSGACEITVDSGLAVYHYRLPGVGK